MMKMNGKPSAQEVGGQPDLKSNSKPGCIDKEFWSQKEKIYIKF